MTWVKSVNAYTCSQIDRGQKQFFLMLTQDLREKKTDIYVAGKNFSTVIMYTALC